MELINTIIMLFWAHIIPLSIKGGIIIVLYFFIRVCFAKKCPSQFLFLIWLVIFIRLSIPFEPAVDCNPFTFFTIPTDAVSNIWQSKMHPLQPMKTTPQSTVNSIAASSHENKINAISRREGPESTPLLPLLIRSVGILWIVGVLLITIKSIIVSILFTVRYKKSKTYVPSPINLLFKQISQEVGIRSKLEISRTVQVPCVSGVFRPTVIFPASLVENLNKN